VTKYLTGCSTKEQFLEGSGLIGCKAVYLVDSPTFRRNISPASSGSKCKPSKKLREVLSLSPVSAAFLLGLHFDIEDGSDMHTRNVGVSPKTWHHNPQDRILHIHGRENLSSKNRSLFCRADMRRGGKIFSTDLKNLILILGKVFGYFPLQYSMEPFILQASRGRKGVKKDGP
jgi:hypothetical protein